MFCALLGPFSLLTPRKNELAPSVHIMSNGILVISSGIKIHNGRAQYWAQKDNMLWTIVAVLLVLWLLGFGFSVGGSLIHLLLVVALVVIVINLVSGRRGVI